MVTSKDSSLDKSINGFLNTRHRFFHQQGFWNSFTNYEMPVQLAAQGIIFGSRYKPKLDEKLSGKLLYVNGLKSQDHWCGATSGIGIWSYYLRFEQDGHLLYELVTDSKPSLSDLAINPQLKRLLVSAKDSGFRIVSPEAERIWVEENHADFTPLECFDSDIQIKSGGSS
ncbi:MAG: hypothetical protein PHF67_01445 [Candidatus Nanoarchaeia archaeon]|nr:hypothetical protein [Candidatus Nanoarchaeia archaeon]